MKFLFLCTSNIHRSKTAHDYFQSLDQMNEYKAAGLNERNCKKFGSTICTEELLDWADTVFVMEQKHIERIQVYTGDKYLDKIINLDIEDKYGYMDPDLIKLLNLKVRLSEEEKNFNQAFEIWSGTSSPGEKPCELIWLQKEGSYITKSMPLYIIEDEKATLEVEAPISGTLKINLPTSSKIKINERHLLGWINPTN